MKKSILGLLVFGLATQFMFTQIVELPEVEVDVNYRYLEAIESADVSEAVLNLEKEVAFYNVRESSMYKDDYDKYTISFFIPEGRIVAAYDKDGKILKTIERFKNVKLPKSILATLAERYPGWEIVEDTYKVNYYDFSGTAKKQYKVKLEKNGMIKNLKFRDDGMVL